MDEEHLVASAIVYPGSTEQVQTVVRWANAHKIPIYPISMGRNRKGKQHLLLVIVAEFHSWIWRSSPQSQRFCCAGSRQENELNLGHQPE
ncbi:MAG: hypothetical protein CL912_00605 [Deltaproteobacteria bacterium]|nr:hypothetical protein [Deltaproteobacteria bacterium]